jgi:hypothetical protein
MAVYFIVRRAVGTCEILDNTDRFGEDNNKHVKTSIGVIVVLHTQIFDRQKIGMWRESGADSSNINYVAYGWL